MVVPIFFLVIDGEKARPASRPFLDVANNTIAVAIVVADAIVR